VQNEAHAGEAIPRMTPAADRRSVTACVLFLRWRVGASPAQAPREPGLLAVARAAIAGWDPAARVVLDAPEGLVIVATVPAASALDAATRAAAADSGRAVTFALHHGVVQALAAGDGEARVHGEVLDAAAALAAAGGSNHVLASQAFRDTLALQSPKLAAPLQPLATRAGSSAPAGAHALVPAAPGRRAVLANLLGVGGIGVLLVAGLWGRKARQEYEAARRPAVLELDIQPWGDITVDGEAKGRSPPVVKLSLAPGAHTLDIRNGQSRPLHMDLQLRPGEELQVKHVFVAPAAPRAQRRARRPGVFERFKFW
jgi:hypothetical protein